METQLNVHIYITTVSVHTCSKTSVIELDCLKLALAAVTLLLANVRASNKESNNEEKYGFKTRKPLNPVPSIATSIQ